MLVFHDQNFNDEQQLAFTQSLGSIELAIGTSLRRPEDHRLPTTFADVSNLDKDNKPFARDDRRRLFAIGNRLWHSDSSFKVVPAKYSLLHARSIPSKGGNTEFADMRAAYDALDQETKDLIEDAGLRALADVLARQARLHRFHRRGAPALQAGAPAAGARAPGLWPQVDLSLLARRHHPRHGPSPRPRRC